MYVCNAATPLPSAPAKVTVCLAAIQAGDPGGSKMGSNGFHGGFKNLKHLRAKHQSNSQSFFLFSEMIVWKKMKNAKHFS